MADPKTLGPGLGVRVGRACSPGSGSPPLQSQPVHDGAPSPAPPCPLPYHTCLASLGPLAPL